MQYTKFFQQQLDLLKNEGRYRTFADLERPMGESPHAIWRHDGKEDRVTVWCSNDYLGMSHHPQVVQAMMAATEKFGTGAGGTRNISGTAHAHVLLEKTVAKLHQKEAGLIFSSGYCANEATISALAAHLPGCVVFSDEKNHASVIQGIKNSRAQRVVFKHNDMVDLEEKLQSIPLDVPKIIIVTSVYSMDGDIAPLGQICALAGQYRALSYVDEVHAVGMYGPRGAGLIAALELEHRVDIIQGNFAKAFGVVGGYIAASSGVIDFVRSFASGFIFTTSLPPAVALAAQTSVELLMTDQKIRQKFWMCVSALKKALAKTDLPVVHNNSHIIPILVGDALRCREISERLLYDHKIYAQPINYPTVPRGSERLRLTITPAHTHDDIQHLVMSLCCIFDQLKQKEAA